MSSPTAPFGPLQRFIEDPACQEIRVSRHDRVFVRHAGHLTHVPEVSFPSDVDLRRFVERLTGWSTATLRHLVHAPPGEMLMVAHFPPERPNVTLDPVQAGYRAGAVGRPDRYAFAARRGAEYLTAAVREGANVLIVGPRESGKATLLNVLVGTLPASAAIAVIDEARRLTTYRPPRPPSTLPQYLQLDDEAVLQDTRK
jgi:pilus assembly protein CpaF